MFHSYILAWRVLLGGLLLLLLGSLVATVTGLQASESDALEKAIANVDISIQISNLDLVGRCSSCNAPSTTTSVSAADAPSNF